MSNVHESWANLLNPDVLRPRVTRAALFIVAFDMLKGSIIDRPREFLNGMFSEVTSPAYAQLLSMDKSPLYASLKWLRVQGAVDDRDLETFGRIKSCRNHLAHEMLKVLAETGLPDDFDETLDCLTQLLRKIEVWWVMEVEIPTNPDYDGRDVDPADVTPGPLVGLQLLFHVALGKPELSRYYYDAYQKRFGGDALT